MTCRPIGPLSQYIRVYIYAVPTSRIYSSIDADQLPGNIPLYKPNHAASMLRLSTGIPFILVYRSYWYTVYNGIPFISVYRQNRCQMSQFTVKKKTARNISDIVPAKQAETPVYSKNRSEYQNSDIPIG